MLVFVLCAANAIKFNPKASCSNGTNFIEDFCVVIVQFKFVALNPCKDLGKRSSVTLIEVDQSGVPVDEADPGFIIGHLLTPELVGQASVLSPFKLEDSSSACSTVSGPVMSSIDRSIVLERRWARAS